MHGQRKVADFMQCKWPSKRCCLNALDCHFERFAEHHFASHAPLRAHNVRRRLLLSLLTLPHPRSMQLMLKAAILATLLAPSASPSRRCLAASTGAGRMSAKEGPSRLPLNCVWPLLQGQRGHPRSAHFPPVSGFFHGGREGVCQRASALLPPAPGLFHGGREGTRRVPFCHPRLASSTGAGRASAKERMSPTRVWPLRRGQGGRPSRAFCHPCPGFFPGGREGLRPRVPGGRNPGKPDSGRASQTGPFG